MDDCDASEIGQTFSSYACLKQIGQGTYGKVYLVHQPSKNDSRKFVLKKIDLKSAKPKQREEAEQEAKLLATLEHPNIVGYRDSFEQNGFLYIIMVYCEGGDMYCHLKQHNGLLAEAQIVEWLVQICLALQYLHDRHILHRDLKTQNIFLTRHKIIKLGDLGIAKVLDSNNDMATTLIGTPFYMSPELFSNKPYDSKSDIWALGCCLYEMMTLKHAFHAKDWQSLVYKILRGQMPVMPKLYSSELIQTLRQMLAMDPQKRPSAQGILRLAFIQQSIRQFLDATKRRKNSDSSSREATPHRSSPKIRRDSQGSKERDLSDDTLVPAQALQPAAEPCRIVVHKALSVPQPARLPAKHPTAQPDSHSNPNRAKFPSALPTKSSSSDKHLLVLRSSQPLPSKPTPTLLQRKSNPLLNDNREPDPQCSAAAIGSKEGGRDRGEEGEGNCEERKEEAAAGEGGSAGREGQASEHDGRDAAAKVSAARQQPAAASAPSLAAAAGNSSWLSCSDDRLFVARRAVRSCDDDSDDEFVRYYGAAASARRRRRELSALHVRGDGGEADGDGAEAKAARPARGAAPSSAPPAAAVQPERPLSADYDHHGAAVSAVASTARQRRRNKLLNDARCHHGVAQRSDLAAERERPASADVRVHPKAKANDADMSSFISLLDTTLQLGSAGAKDEADGAAPEAARGGSGGGSKIIQKPGELTLNSTGRLFGRISALRQDCMKGLGYAKLKQCYDILDECDAVNNALSGDDEKTLENRLTAVLGPVDFERFAAKIFQLKFCEDFAYSTSC